MTIAEKICTRIELKSGCNLSGVALENAVFSTFVSLCEKDPEVSKLEGQWDSIVAETISFYKLKNGK